MYLFCFFKGRPYYFFGLLKKNIMFFYLIENIIFGAIIALQIGKLHLNNGICAENQQSVENHIC